jgi:hypothetical protein
MCLCGELLASLLARVVACSRRCSLRLRLHSLPPLGIIAYIPLGIIAYIPLGIIALYPLGDASRVQYVSQPILVYIYLVTFQ